MLLSKPIPTIDNFHSYCSLPHNKTSPTKLDRAMGRWMVKVQTQLSHLVVMNRRRRRRLFIKGASTSNAWRERLFMNGCSSSPFLLSSSSGDGAACQELEHRAGSPTALLFRKTELRASQKVIRCVALMKGGPVLVRDTDTAM